MIKGLNKILNRKDNIYIEAEAKGEIMMNDNNTTSRVSIDFEALDDPKVQANRPSTHSGKTEARTIPFSIKKMGYDQYQVDQYLQKLMGEYSNLQQNYTDLSGKYYRLTRQPVARMEAIAKALVNAEANAMKIVADAKAEATRIVQEAHRDLVLVQNERTRLEKDIDGIIGRLQPSAISA